jgi:DNA-binding beta-propeller fold protein YncE
MTTDTFCVKTRRVLILDNAAAINEKIIALIFSLLSFVLLGLVIMISSGNIVSLVYAQEEEYEFVSKFASQGPNDGQVISPYDVVIDSSSGNVYIVDTGNSRVQKFTTDGSFIKKWGNQGSGNSQFSFPSSIAIDPAGNIYVLDSGNSRVQKFTSDGSYITEWNIAGTKRGQFTVAPGIAIDPSSGNVYVSNTTGHNIIKYSPDGSYIDSWGENGYGDDQFSFPSSIDVDRTGYVYVVDSGSHSIKKFTSEGKFITKWGSQGTGDSQFISPTAISTDASGNVYVVDTGNNRIQKFTSDGTFITKWSDGQFNKPSGIAIEPSSNNVYVVDTGNHQIDIFAKPNQPPIALAGPDQVVDENTTVTLDGTPSSDEDGNIISYLWKQTAGDQSVTLIGNNTDKPTFIAPSVRTDTILQFALTTVDNNNVTSATADTVTVRVKNVVNNPPVAENKSVTTDENVPVDIVLTGSDVDKDDILTFQIMTNALHGRLNSFDNYTGKVSYMPDSNYSGADSFTFRVRDNKGVDSRNIGKVSITVNSVNISPIANNVTTTISNNFTRYENSTYGISIQYPSNWFVEELDLYSNDRVIPIVTFYSPLETHIDQYQESLSINLDNISYQADLEEYLQEALDIYRNNTNFRVLESNTISNLAGMPAYSLIYSWTTQNPPGQHNYNLKTMEIAAITENNRGYYIDYYAEEDKYDDYLPTIQKMIDSLVIDISASLSLQEQAVTQPTTDTVLLEDNFNSENGGAGILNYVSFANWDVIGGTVDILGNGFYDVEQSNGLYVDLDGSTNDAGILESKTEFKLEPGDYILEFDLGNYHSDNVNTVKVQLGDVFVETFTMESGSPFTHITKNIHVPGYTSAKLSFDHSGGDNFGIYLDNVKLSSQRSDQGPSTLQDGSQQGNQSVEVQSNGVFLSYENFDFGIKIDFSSDWEIDENDSNPDNRITDIARFQSPIEITSDKFPENLLIAVEDLPFLNETLDGYFQKNINSRIDNSKDFKLIESNRNSILAGYPAYNLVYASTIEDGTNLKVMEIGTIISNKAYFIEYFAEAEKYDTYLPTIQKMIDSFEIITKPT